MKVIDGIGGLMLRIALTTLKEWLKSHQDDPYPTENEKIDLERLTGLRIGQINTWFANARRRIKGHAETRSAPSCVIESIDHLREQESVVIDLEERTFQCTFCTDTFKLKHDWTRHESSLHLSLKRYICCPLSPAIINPNTRLVTCAYCNAAGPTPEHIEMHNHSECQARGPDAHTFFRKDHLRQHLRSVHASQLLPHMDAWTLEAVIINSRCGFCGKRFIVWNERNDHIAAHFRDGFQMHQWRGCRRLDPVISAEVTAAMPPFLIGLERRSLRPFSTSRQCGLKSVMTKRQTISRKIDRSLWEILATNLHLFTKQQSEQGFAVSDEELRSKARMILYGTSQTQTVTAADNPEWLDLFKKAHSFDILPESPEAEVQNIPDDLEIYQDLGVRLPSSLRRKLHTETALVSMFLSECPQAKNYPRFSSLLVCPEKALRFETIAGPWPDAGVLGETIITRDWIFSLTIQRQLAMPCLHLAIRPTQEEIQAKSSCLSLQAASDADWGFYGSEKIGCGVLVLAVRVDYRSGSPGLFDNFCSKDYAKATIMQPQLQRPQAQALKHVLAKTLTKSPAPTIH